MPLRLHAKLLAYLWREFTTFLNEMCDPSVEESLLYRVDDAEIGRKVDFSVTPSLILRTSIANICDIAIKAPGSMDPEVRGSSCFQRIHSPVVETTTPKPIVIECNENNEPTQSEDIASENEV